MPAPGRVGAVVLGAALLMVPVRVAAQAELQMFMSPELGKQMPRADYRYTFYPERSVDQGGTLAMMEHRLSAYVPLFQNSRDEFAIAARGIFQDLDNDTQLPDSGVPFPEHLWDVSATLSFRHKFDNGWIAGLGVSGGTASDEPFKSMDEVYWRALAMVRIPWRERDAWILSILYASDQDIFGLKHTHPRDRVPVELLRAVPGGPGRPVFEHRIQADQVCHARGTVLSDLDDAHVRHLGDLPPVASLRGLRLGQRSLVPLRPRRQGRQALLLRETSDHRWLDSISGTSASKSSAAMRSTGSISRARATRTATTTGSTSAPRRSSSAGCTFASEQNSARDGVRGFRRGRLTGAGRRPPA